MIAFSTAAKTAISPCLLAMVTSVLISGGGLGRRLFAYCDDHVVPIRGVGVVLGGSGDLVSRLTMGIIRVTI